MADGIPLLKFYFILFFIIYNSHIIPIDCDFQISRNFKFYLFHFFNFFLLFFLFIFIHDYMPTTSLLKKLSTNLLIFMEKNCIWENKKLFEKKFFNPKNTLAGTKQWVFIKFLSFRNDELLKLRIRSRWSKST